MNDEEPYSGTFNVTCACGQHITVDHKKVGQKGRCPCCKRKMTILDSTVVSGDDESFDGPLINDDKATKSDQSLADEPANSAKPEDVDSKEPDAKEKKASALKRFLSNKLSF